MTSLSVFLVGSVGEVNCKVGGGGAHRDTSITWINRSTLIFKAVL